MLSRGGNLTKRHNLLARSLHDREHDYLRFTTAGESHLLGEPVLTGGTVRRIRASKRYKRTPT